MRENKFVDSRSLKQNVDPSLHRIVKIIMDDVLDTCLIPIDICELLGNSDILQRIPEGASEQEMSKMMLSTDHSGLENLRKKYNLPQMHYFSERFRIQELRIHKLYFLDQSIHC